MKTKEEQLTGPGLTDYDILELENKKLKRRRMKRKNQLYNYQIS